MAITDVVTTAHSSISGVKNGASIVCVSELGSYKSVDPKVNQYLSSGTMCDRYDERFDEHYGGGAGGLIGQWLGTNAVRVNTVNTSVIGLDKTNDFLAVEQTTVEPVTVNLPSALSSWNSGSNMGRTYTIADAGYNASTNNITITPSGSDVIVAAGVGGAETSLTINGDGDAIRVVAISSTKWMVY